MSKDFDIPKDATPIDDVSELIPAWVHHLGDLNRVEAENILSAQRKYLRVSVRDPKTWFKVVELKAIHKGMFGNVWRWAGAYRKSITSIGINPSLIPSQLAEFCFEVVSWLRHPVELTFLEMAARIHHRLVFIHPFENGNGRFSRLIADRFLLALKCKHPLWPNHMNQEGLVRTDYIHTLKSADKGDYAPLIELMQTLGASDPPLTELVKNSFYKPYMNAKKGVALLKALLRNHSNPNDQTPNGHRLLQLAISDGLEEIAKMLVHSGAEVDSKDQSGLTPFQVAVQQENKTLADFLLSKGAKQQSSPELDAKYNKLYPS